MVSGTEEGKFVEILKGLREDIENLRHGGYIPRVAQDPDVNSGITLWMLHDGRLRGRKSDGTIQEWAKTEHTHPGISGASVGSGASTVPAPAAPYTPSEQHYAQNADWSQAYWRGGGEQYANADNKLYYGMFTAATGELKSMIHFPGLTALAPGPAGTRIIDIHLVLTNVHTNLNAGTILKVGLHNAATKPPSFTQTEWPVAQINVGKPSPEARYRLPNIVAETMRDNPNTGITLNQNSTNRGLYGWAAGVGLPGYSPPRLEITFVK